MTCAPIDGIQRLSVIVLNGEVERFDALKITLVDFVLCARPVRLRSAEELAHHGDRAFHDIETGQIRSGAPRDQFLAQFLIDEREEYQTLLRRNVFDRAIQLLAAAYKDIGMLFNEHAFKLCERCLGDGVEGFARRVGDKMNVEFVTHQFMLRLCTDD